MSARKRVLAILIGSIAFCLLAAPRAAAKCEPTFKWDWGTAGNGGGCTRP
jgi:hypothetical protein